MSKGHRLTWQHQIERKAGIDTSGELLCYLPVVQECFSAATRLSFRLLTTVTTSIEPPGKDQGSQFKDHHSSLVHELGRLGYDTVAQIAQTYTVMDARSAHSHVCMLFPCSVAACGVVLSVQGPSRQGYIQALFFCFVCLCISLFGCPLGHVPEKLGLRVWDCLLWTCKLGDRRSMQGTEISVQVPAIV